MESGARPLRTSEATSSARSSAEVCRFPTSERRNSALSAMALSAIARPTTTTAATVVRTRTERTRLPALGCEPVTHAPHRLDRLAAVGGTELAAEIPDVDLDDVGVAVEGEVPDMSEYVGLGQH